MTAAVCLSFREQMISKGYGEIFFEVAYISMTKNKREALAGKGNTDFLFPLDTSTLKS